MEVNPLNVKKETWYDFVDEDRAAGWRMRMLTDSTSENTNRDQKSHSQNSAGSRLRLCICKKICLINQIKVMYSRNKLSFLQVNHPVFPKCMQIVSQDFLLYFTGLILKDQNEAKITVYPLWQECEWSKDIRRTRFISKFIINTITAEKRWEAKVSTVLEN